MTPSATSSLLLITVCDSLTILEMISPSLPRTIPAYSCYLGEIINSTPFTLSVLVWMINYIVFLLRADDNVLMYID